MKIRRLFLLVSVLVMVLVFSVAFLLKTNYEAPNWLNDTHACQQMKYSESEEIWISSFGYSEIACDSYEDVIPVEQLMAYLEKQENSPPLRLFFNLI